MIGLPADGHIDPPHAFVWSRGEVPGCQGSWRRAEDCLCLQCSAPRPEPGLRIAGSLTRPPSFVPVSPPGPWHLPRLCGTGYREAQPCRSGTWGFWNRQGWHSQDRRGPRAACVRTALVSAGSRLR